MITADIEGLIMITKITNTGTWVPARIYYPFSAEEAGRAE